MGFTLLDDGLHDHPKVMALLDQPDGLAALGLWTLTLTWNRRHRVPDDPAFGEVNRSTATRLAGSIGRARKLAGKLVDVGLYDSTEHGWRIHDAEDWIGNRTPTTPSPATPDGLSDKQREQRRQAAQARWSASSPHPPASPPHHAENAETHPDDDAETVRGDAESASPASCGLTPARGRAQDADARTPAPHARASSSPKTKTDDRHPASPPQHPEPPHPDTTVGRSVNGYAGDPRLRELAAALATTIGPGTDWSTLPPLDADDTARLLERHGLPALVDAAKTASFSGRPPGQAKVWVAAFLSLDHQPTPGASRGDAPGIGVTTRCAIHKTDLDPDDPRCAACESEEDPAIPATVVGRGAKMPAELRGAARPGMPGGGSGPVDAPAESA